MLVISEVQMMIIDVRNIPLSLSIMSSQTLWNNFDVITQVVATDKNPVDLWYVQNLDYVWILNWRSEMNVGVKTVQIIKEAAQRKKHHTVRPEPIDAQFDLVKGLYIPQQRVRFYSHKNLHLSILYYTDNTDLKSPQMNLPLINNLFD